MNKAEERSKKLIIPKQVDDIEELCRFYYIKGYHQAEKDLELIWQDVDTIYNLLGEEFNYQLECGKRPQKEACQEVLKRFKDYKERKEQ